VKQDRQECARLIGGAADLAPRQDALPSEGVGPLQAASRITVDAIHFGI